MIDKKERNLFIQYIIY